MPRPAVINTLPAPVKNALIGKLLARERYHAISEWLSQAHGVTLSTSALQRIGKPLQDNYAPLLALGGMPIAEIVRHWRQIDAIGIEQARQELLEKLNAKNGGPFAYLDQPMKPTTRQTQQDKIKADLLTGKPVDSVTGFNQHCITRLSAIIKRLRDNGWPVHTDQDKGNGLARYSVPDGWTPSEPAQTIRQKKPVKSTTI
ncbi:MAG: helix-turn-helix domain-containing protein [Methylovulum sp.]|nr:helix-turn-helix domain-containing protein [Methylovulum sp.]